MFRPMDLETRSPKTSDPWQRDARARSLQGLGEPLPLPEGWELRRTGGAGAHDRGRPTLSSQGEGRDGSPEEKNRREAAPSLQSRHPTTRARTDTLGGRPSAPPRQEPREEPPGSGPGPAAPSPLTSAIVVVAAILSFPSATRDSRESTAARAGKDRRGGSLEKKKKKSIARSREEGSCDPSGCQDGTVTAGEGRDGVQWTRGGSGLRTGCCGPQSSWVSAGPVVPGVSGRSKASGAAGRAVTGWAQDKTSSNRLKCWLNPGKPS